MRLPFSHDRAAPTAPVVPAVETPPPVPRAAPRVNLVSRAYELANADWTEQEAAVELARVAQGDRAQLVAAYEQLVAHLVRTTTVDPRGVRATRVVSRATRLQSSGD